MAGKNAIYKTTMCDPTDLYFFFIFCTMTNKLTIISPIITLLHVCTVRTRPVSTYRLYIRPPHRLHENCSNKM